MPKTVSMRRRAIFVALICAYPPRLVLDFHEDDGIERGYIYSQGRLGRDDGVAARIVAEFGRRHFPLVHTGTTRFHEEIRDGVVSDVQDGSIDELLSAPRIIRERAVENGPAAPTILVIETGARGIPLSERVKGHGYVMQMLDILWTAAAPTR